MTRLARLRCAACGRQTGAVDRTRGTLTLGHDVRHRATDAELDQAAALFGDAPPRHDGHHLEAPIPDPRRRRHHLDERTAWPCSGCGRQVTLAWLELADALDAHERSGRTQTIHLPAESTP